MGNQQQTAKQELSQVRRRASTSTQVTGRYHILPRSIESDYVVEKTELGTGHNGSVYSATSRLTGEKCAVKPFKLYHISKAQRRELRNEVEVTLAMDHPHVARLRDVYEGDEYLQLVTERLEGGELFDRIMKYHHFTEHDARDATYQILLAINYLHSKGVVHRDIKLENFLYDTKECKHLKLIDFGFSRFANPTKTMKLGCGTLAYMAPEVISGEYTAKCDVWSAGVVVFILLMGYMPFKGSNEEVQAAIQAGSYELKQGRWDSLSENGRSFLRRLLQVDPQVRPSAEQALQLPWMVETEDQRSRELAVDDSIVHSLRSFARASRFRRVCMSMMAWSLTNEERSQVRAAFVELDKDKTGTLTLVELKEALQQTVGVPGDEAQQIFDAMDSNNQDESVNYSDFLAAMMASRIQMHEDLLYETFKRFDLDNQGYMTSRNLREVLGGSLSQQEADALMNEADPSEDGKITWEEFCHYMHRGVASPVHREAVEKVIENEIRNTLNTRKSVNSEQLSCLRLTDEAEADEQLSDKQLPVSPVESKQTGGKSEPDARSATPLSATQQASKMTLASRFCTVM